MEKLIISAILFSIYVVHPLAESSQEQTGSHISFDVDTALADSNINITDESQLLEITSNMLVKYGFQNISLIETAAKEVATSTLLMNSTHLREKALEKVRDELYAYSRNNFEFVCSLGLYVGARADNSDAVRFFLGENADPYLLDSDKRHALHIASARGNSEIVRDILRVNPVGVNWKDKYGLTPLFMAVVKNRTEVCRLLLENGAAPDVTSSAGTTPLYVAITKGFVRIAKLLISNKKEMVNWSYGGYTFLQIALANDQIEIVEHLVENGADTFPTYSNGSTPLHLVSPKGNYYLADLLTRKSKTGIDKKDWEGCTALYLAALRNETEIVKLLLQRGANPILASDYRLLPLQFAVRYDNVIMCELLIPAMKKRVKETLPEIMNVYLEIFAYNKIQMLSCLLRNNASSFLPENSESLLHLAILYDSIGPLKLMLEHNLEFVDTVGNRGITPLYLAIINNMSYATELLLNHGADPLLLSEYNGLHLAVNSQNNKIVELIVPPYKKQHLIDAKDDKDQTPLCIGARLQSASIVRTLLLYGANPYICCGKQTALHYAVFNRDLTTVEIILYYHNGTRDIRNYHRRTPLQLAVELDDIDIVKFLLKVGADPYIPSFDDLPEEELRTRREKVVDDLALGAPRFVADFRRLNSLFSAVIENNLPIVEQLVEARSYGINHQNRDGHSVLHISVMARHSEMSKYLLRSYISPHLKDKHSWTALHYAVNNSDIVHSEMLLANWKSESECVHYKTEDGLTPLLILIRKRSKDAKLLKLVLSRGAGCDSLDSLMLMHYAVGIESVEFAQSLLACNFNINQKDNDGVTPLILATRKKSFLMAKYLLDERADPNLYDSEGKTSLHVAVGVQSMSIAVMLLDSNATQINAQDNNGITPLWEAALINSLHMFQFLLNRGADPNLFSIKGLTVFHTIAAEGNLKLAVSLLNKINFDLETNNGTSALIIAIINNRVLFFNFLLDKGADPNNADAVGKTPLHHAAESSNPEFIETIISRTKLSLNRPDISGNTPLMLCLRRRQISPANLLKHGADPYVRNVNGYSAIHMAAMSGNIEAIEVLIDHHGVNINLLDKRNHTALMIAAMREESAMVEYLLKSGADPCLISMANTSILHYLVCYNDLQTVIKVYISIKSRCYSQIELNRQDIHGKNLLACPAAKAIDEVFFYLVENGADLFAITTQKKTLLHFAAEGGSVSIIEHILRNGITLLESHTLVGETPLFLAARHGNDKAFEILLKYGAKKTAVSEYGETLIHAASFGGNVHIANILLEDQETDIEASDLEGNTPLMYAVSNEQITMTEFLIGKSANTLATNIDGEDALSRAASTGNIDLLHALSKNTNDSVDSLIGILMSSNNGNLTPQKLELLLLQSTIAKNDLFIAAAMGNYERLKDILKHENKLIRKGFFQLLFEFTREYESLLEDVLEEDQNFPSYRAILTPLDLAILFFGRINSVKLLIGHFKVDIRATGVRKSLWTPLELACVSTGLYDRNTSVEKDLVFLYLLKNAEPSLNHSDRFGWNIVHKAAWVGNSRAIYALYQRGADISKVDNYGRTPLHIAALKGFHEAVRILLYLSSEIVNRHDVYGFTPLHLTQIYRIKKFYKMLSRTTVTMDPELRYRLVENLDLGRSRSGDGLPRDYLRTMDTLLRSRADIDLRDKTFAWTPLHWAAASGDLRTAEFLVARGASVNIPSNRDETPMYLARFWGRRDVYLYLMSKNGVW